MPTEPHPTHAPRGAVEESRRAREFDRSPVETWPDPGGRRPRSGWEDDQDSLTSVAVRHWWYVLFFVVVFVAGGLILGFLRAPTYRAEAQLTAGSISARTQAVPGYVEAAKSLAGSYSRVAATPDVVNPVATEAGLSRATVRNRVTVSPVVDSPLITIRTTGPTRSDAVRLASVTTDVLTDTVRRINRVGTEDQRLLREFRRASADALASEAKLQRLREERDRDPTAVSSGAVRNAAAAAESDRLKVQVASSLYTEARQSQAPAAGVELLDPAHAAGSDRSEKLQQLAFVGLIAGFAVGMSLAALAEGRRRRRRRRAG